MRKISFVNKTGFLLAMLLFGYAAYTLGPTMLINNTHEMLAAVGVSLSVAPNPYNTIASQLAEKQKALDERQAALDAQSVTRDTSLFGKSYGFWSLCASAGLFILVLINFVSDITFRKKLTVVPQ